MVVDHDDVIGKIALLSRRRTHGIGYRPHPVVDRYHHRYIDGEVALLILHDTLHGWQPRPDSLQMAGTGTLHLYLHGPVLGVDIVKLPLAGLSEKRSLAIEHLPQMEQGAPTGETQAKVIESGIAVGDIHLRNSGEKGIGPKKKQRPQVKIVSQRPFVIIDTGVRRAPSLLVAPRIGVNQRRTRVAGNRQQAGTEITRREKFHSGQGNQQKALLHLTRHAAQRVGLVQGGVPKSAAGYVGRIAGRTETNCLHFPTRTKRVDRTAKRRRIGVSEETADVGIIHEQRVYVHPGPLRCGMPPRHGSPSRAATAGRGPRHTEAPSTLQSCGYPGLSVFYW